MNPGRPTGGLLLLVVALAVSPPTVHAANAQSSPAAAALCDEALGLAYNLDHNQALALLRRAVALAPDDPAPHRSLASVLWMNILFQRGAVTVDHYLGAFTGSTLNLTKPPPEVDAEFRTQVGLALSLAEARVKVHGNDAQAHYDLGSALGLQASYVATVEGRTLAGVRAARQSFNEHERVLALDPSRKDAGLIVGTYRYVISTLTLPMRVMAYVAGFGGGRERGIQLIEDAASRQPRHQRITPETREPKRCLPSYWCTTGNAGSTTGSACCASCGTSIRATAWSCSKREPRRFAAAGRRTPRAAHRRADDAGEGRADAHPWRRSAVATTSGVRRVRPWAATSRRTTCCAPRVRTPRHGSEAGRGSSSVASLWRATIVQRRRHVPATQNHSASRATIPCAWRTRATLLRSADGR